MEDEVYSSAYKGKQSIRATQQSTKSIRPGFGSMAEDNSEAGFDLNAQLVMNKSSTYFFRMKGDAMEGAGIHAGDLLIVDRAQKAANGRILIASVEGELLIRRYNKTFNKLFLEADNPRCPPIEITEYSRFDAWGVVTCVIHPVDSSLVAWQHDDRSVRTGS